MKGRWYDNRETAAASLSYVWSHLAGFLLFLSLLPVTRLSIVDEFCVSVECLEAGGFRRTVEMTGGVEKQGLVCPGATL